MVGRNVVVAKFTRKNENESSPRYEYNRSIGMRVSGRVIFHERRICLNIGGREMIARE